eukprot:m.1181183 g.1181183  ORF g.1181183 m.1181183 type:complete len:80 (+) comp24533_c0_seq14:3789-4028(+)
MRRLRCEIILGTKKMRRKKLCVGYVIWEQLTAQNAIGDKKQASDQSSTNYFSRILIKSVPHDVFLQSTTVLLKLFAKWA